MTEEIEEVEEVVDSKEEICSVALEYDTSGLTTEFTFEIFTEEVEVVDEKEEEKTDEAEVKEDEDEGRSLA